MQNHHPRRKLLTILQKSSSSSLIPTSSTMSYHEKVEKEIESYLLCSKLDIESDVTLLEWWKTNANTFPLLARLAKKYLLFVQLAVHLKDCLVLVGV